MISNFHGGSIAKDRTPKLREVIQLLRRKASFCTQKVFLHQTPNDIHVFRLVQLKKLRKTKAKEEEIAPEKQFQKLKLQGDELLLRNYMFKKRFISNMRSKPTIKPGINVCISKY